MLDISILEVVSVGILNYISTNQLHRKGLEGTEPAFCLMPAGHVLSDWLNYCNRSYGLFTRDIYFLPEELQFPPE